jgi:hypothetical protein
MHYLIQLNLIIFAINLNLWKVSKYPMEEEQKPDEDRGIGMSER